MAALHGCESNLAAIDLEDNWLLKCSKFGGAESGFPASNLAENTLCFSRKKLHVRGKTILN